jgi:hypothetical protein
MLTKSVLVKIALAGTMAMASMSPTLAAKRAMHTPRPCASPQLRCIADCDKFHWCRVYACSANETVVLPFPCNEDGGLCFAPHC